MYPFFQSPRVNPNARRRQERQDFFPSFPDPLVLDPFLQSRAVEDEEEEEAVDPLFAVLKPNKQRQLRQQQLEQQRQRELYEQQLERQRQQELYEQQLAKEQEEEALRREAALRALQLQQQEMQQHNQHNHRHPRHPRHSHDGEPEMHQAEHTAHTTDKHHHAQQKPQQAQHAQAQPQQKNLHHPQQHLQQQHAQQQEHVGQQVHGPKRRNRRQRKHEAHDFKVNEAPALHLHPPADDIASLVEAAFGGENDEPMPRHAQSRNIAVKPARSIPISTASSAFQEPEVSESSDSTEQDERELRQEMIEASDDEPMLVNREIQQKSWKELGQVDVFLNELAEELDLILAGKIPNRKRVLLTEENLTKAMLRIDAVESGGDVAIRKRRKELIGRIERMLALVDEYKRRARISVDNPIN